MSSQVRDMFASIARRYDHGNQVLSMGLHHRWRRAAVLLSGANEGGQVLDCATGTGDLALEFQRAVGETGRVIGTDFCAEMLEIAREKAARDGRGTRFEEADALRLPYASGAFDVASIAFGIRNVDDPVRGLEEMARVVRPGGSVVVLEFGQPGGALFGPLYRFYSASILPQIGGWLTGERRAYEYLHRTSSSFPSGEAFVAMMRGTRRFTDVRARSLTGGIAYVYVGTVGAAS
ncbi:MAG TPA: bifunctional demethylmenaquinone methyltransferase/2-methoxy-6-polyprenyl-1,4-benzoquinol methylase UbiE [Candidatus Dormibacteraeota bacterium]|nr:bifunctional demethylmenaquinone methyltransferase/2-methoxy-6-polyprenyl-1,4-benzoquinol methylase UbiE [Candidatus Dormibacteraeota bacterium]